VARLANGSPIETVDGTKGPVEKLNVHRRQIRPLWEGSGKSGVMKESEISLPTRGAVPPPNEMVPGLLPNDDPNSSFMVKNMGSTGSLKK
jgi:hypothetical protein